MFNLKTYFHWTYIRDIKIPKIQFTENFFHACFRMLKFQSRISKGHWRTELLNRRTDKDVHADQMLSGSPGFRPDDLSTGVPITTSDVWKASRNDFHIRCIFFKNMFGSKAVEILCLCLILKKIYRDGNFKIPELIFSILACHIHTNNHQLHGLQMTFTNSWTQGQKHAWQCQRTSDSLSDRRDISGLVGQGNAFSVIEHVIIIKYCLVLFL